MGSHDQWEFTPFPTPVANGLSLESEKRWEFTLVMCLPLGLCKGTVKESMEALLPIYTLPIQEKMVPFIMNKFTTCLITICLWHSWIIQLFWLTEALRHTHTHIYIYTVETLYNTINFCWSTDKKTLHSSPERARYGVSFVSSKGNILFRLINIELYKIFAIINRAIKGLHCIHMHQ